MPDDYFGGATTSTSPNFKTLQILFIIEILAPILKLKKSEVRGEYWQMVRDKGGLFVVGFNSRTWSEVQSKTLLGTQFSTYIFGHHKNGW